MTTTLEQPGTTRSPDGLAPAAASPAWKSWAVAPRGGEAAGISGITAPSPELAVHPSRDGGGREPGDDPQETDGGTLTETTSPRPARVHPRRVAGCVAHEPCRAGAGVARWKNRECPRRLPAHSAPDRGRTSLVCTLLRHDPFAAGPPGGPPAAPLVHRSGPGPTSSTRSRTGELGCMRILLWRGYLLGGTGSNVVHPPSGAGRRSAVTA